MKGLVYRPLGTFRLVLALLVVCNHAGEAFLPEPSRSFLIHSAVGGLSVLAFFAVSGFVISEAADVFYGARPFAFASNRILRIFPPLYFAMALSALTLFVLLSLNARVFEYRDGMLSAQSILGNLLAPFDLRILNSTENYFILARYMWAVIVELHFYVVVAVGIGLKASFPRIFRLYVTILLVSSAAPVLAQWNLFLPVYPGGFWRDVWFFPCFAAGFCMYQATKSPWYGIPAACFSALSVWVHCHNTLQAILLGVMFAALGVLIVIHVPDRVRRIDARVGDLTYMVYLNQYTPIALVFAAFSPGWVAFFVTLLCSVLIGILSWFATEPITRNIRNVIRSAPVR